MVSPVIGMGRKQLLSAGRNGMRQHLKDKTKDLQREEREMKKITEEAGDVEGQKLAKKNLLLWRRTTFVFLGAIPPAAVLIAVAYAQPLVFELLACLTYYLCAVFIAWVPLRDTSALAINFNYFQNQKLSTANEISRDLWERILRRRVRLLRLLQWATPFLLTALYGISRIGVRRIDANVVVDLTAQAVLSLMLPSFVYWLRWTRSNGVRDLSTGLNLGRVARPLSSALPSKDKLLTFQPSHPGKLRRLGYSRSRVAPSMESEEEVLVKSKSPRRTQAYAVSSTPPPSPPISEVATEAPKTVEEASASPERASSLTTAAAIRLQAGIRRRHARVKLRLELAERRKRLRAFSHPMFLATIVYLIGNAVVAHHFRNNDAQTRRVGQLISLIFVLPGVVIVIVDLNRKEPVRFSLAHGMYLIGVLYQIGFKAVDIDKLVWDQTRDFLLASSVSMTTADIAVPLIGMTVHLTLFIIVTTLAFMALALIASPNACPHLLFPFQFFDFIFLHAFFNLRSAGSAITVSYVLQQLLFQLNVIFRNSGTLDALLTRYLGTCNALLSGYRLKAFDPNNDPLLKLQFIARVSWQYDLADVAALLATPLMVTLFVWRDGYFTLEGTSILILNCELPTIWARFALLLVIKPAASTIARMWLRAKMRKTLLGKRTMHGTSQIAAKIIAERKIRHRGKGQTRNADDKVREHFNFKEEELEALQEELSLSGLNFAVLRAKLMKKWRFFTCVVLLQLFAAFPVRQTAPGQILKHEPIPCTAGPCTGQPVNSSYALSMRMEPLPVFNVWYYVPPEVARKLSSKLQNTWERRAHGIEGAGNDLQSCTRGMPGWTPPALDEDLSLIVSATRVDES